MSVLPINEVILGGNEKDVVILDGEVRCVHILEHENGHWKRKSKIGNGYERPGQSIKLTLVLARRI